MNTLVKIFLGVLINSLFLLAYNLESNGENCGPTYEATDKGIIALHKYNEERLIVGGAFNTIYKNTTSEETIYRLAEANLSNGGCTLHNRFNFTFNTDENDNEGWIRSLDSYRNYLFIGGDFDFINGEPRRGLAVVDLNTNQLLNWNPDIGVQFNGSTDSDGISVHTLKVDMINKTLHVGGDFTTPHRGYIHYDISSLDNNDVSQIQLNTSKSGLDGDVWDIKRDVSTGKLYMVGSFTNKFAEISNNIVTTYNIGFTGTPYAMGIKPNSKVFIGGNDNEFKAIELPALTIDNTWTPSIGGTISYERWGSSTFKMTYVDDDNIIIGVNGLASINTVPITQVGSVDLSGLTSAWRQNKIYAGDYLHALLNTNDWVYLAASSVRFTRFERNHGVYPEVSINDVSEFECTAPSLTNQFIFTLTLNTPAPSEGSTVWYKVNDATAKISNNDYLSQEGSVFFSAGESSKDLNITINCDATIEADETFTVTLSNPLSVTISDNTGLGTIKNDDSLVIVPSTFTLGNRVWVDTNKDGIQNNNEIGFTGAKVDLYKNKDCTGSVAETNTTINGIYTFTKLLAGDYCVAFSNLPNNYSISPANQGADVSLNSDANVDGKITNINLSSDNLTYDLGIYATAIPINEPTVQIGNRVWIENDDDGNASTGVITPVVGQLVIATASGGTEYSGLTDTNGNYLITVPQNDTYVVRLTVPSNYIATGNSSDNRIVESILENDLSHDANGTTVVLTTVDNLTVDFGFRLTTVLATTVCEEMNVNDDIQNANSSSATTTIDVLNNDTGSKSGQVINFLSLTEGKALWENPETTISSVTGLNTLSVAGEGTWRVVDNKVAFTALDSFDGQIPSPIYYIISGSDCTANTQYSNVAKVTIDTACTCPNYSTKSVNTLGLLSILVLMFLTMGLSFVNLKEKV
ncbi:MAG: Serine-aspartate repeat-containing protein D [uncultured Sulfurovum sp.]|uniref:Serine-aspartate repeat-containing protein D n=1 Tax=uncultured Sulfurovum sp. TaxID=269237 RepID=A0A6S6SWM6_9BACT|nr:MAG: Serine-aspartate repeat-containing protein D [uncultured Sulfurovum sp.]